MYVRKRNNVGKQLIPGGYARKKNRQAEDKKQTNKLFIYYYKFCA